MSTKVTKIPAPRTTKKSNANWSKKHSNLTLKHSDSRFEWNTSYIEKWSKFKQELELGKLYCKSGDSMIYLTKRIGEGKCFNTLTKIMKYKSTKDLLQIIQEHKVVRALGLFGYGSLYFGPNKNEICLPMQYCKYTLRQSLIHKKDLERHSFDYFVHHKYDKSFVFKMNKKSLESIKYFILEIAGNLHTLHSNNYVHLDIKPSNIVFHSAIHKDSMHLNQWKLIDYGLCKYVDPSNGNKHILLKSYMGTMGYTAPEMNIYANKNRPNAISAKTDIWGLAVSVLYILNRGFNVFQVTSEEKEELKEKMPEKERGNAKRVRYKQYEHFYKHKLKAVGENGNKGEGAKMVRKHLKSLLFKKVINLELFKLLKQMFAYNPEMRPSAQEIIEHKMFKKYIIHSKCKKGYFIKYHQSRLPKNKSVTLEQLPSKWRQLTNPIL